jgi:hypothetical protein
MKPQPTQPPETDWHFVQELQAPLWTQLHWKARTPETNQTSLAGGVFIARHFPDENNLLETAYADIQHFLCAGDIPVSDAPGKSTFTIETAHGKTDVPEAYRISITPEKALVEAADSEGIRRGIFHLEEEMLRAGGPFLPLGEIARTPVIRTRISRCFFGPINRPPKNRDELADETDYYPEQYLNRLAHHGVNGLWLTIKFSDLCPSRFFPDHGKDAPRRLEKLRRTVARCARYGIKIYIFCIEPRGFGGISEYMSPPETLEHFPELGGHKSGPYSYFCTSSAEGREYLESCTHHIFSNVPELGGLIDINLGERPTHCYSSTATFSSNNCPRCSQRSIADVFADTTDALQRGMHRANPNAEMVSWLYVPYLGNVSEEEARYIQNQMAQIAAKTPPKVLLQVNFESQGVTSQWGRDHLVLDYSLAYAGPSQVFADCAAAVVQAGARVSAKLQVGNSHEVATVPFVPAPGNLYRKYKKMHELGVSSAMQCWFFGNYPSVMTQAAGELAFAPLPENEIDFLQQLAATHWGENAATVAAAWQHFRDAYEQFPAVLQFSWFGPVHDCINWPLHLNPVDEIIQPSWLLKPDASGDRVAECFAYEFSRDEIIETCRRMDVGWQKGVQLLEQIKSRYQDQRERWTEIGVAQALGLQFHSAWNVMRFYALRDELPFVPQRQQRADLETMRQIVVEEIANSKKLAQLAQDDSRLGFHSEAEGYKYFPAKLAWRIDQLETLLAEDFPDIKRQIKAGKVLFSEFSGTEPQGAVYRAAWQKETQNPDWKVLLSEQCAHVTSENPVLLDRYKTAWQLAADDNNLYIKVDCQTPQPVEEDDRVVVTVEPRRCWPSQKFTVGVNGATSHENRSPMHDYRWRAKVHTTTTGWQAELTIPWVCFRESYQARRPIRLNVSRTIGAEGTLAWQPHRPLPGRLIFGDDNSADYGWSIFEERSIACDASKNNERRSPEGVSSD